MRADRLVAALLVLQARGRVTAAQLAEELDVSVATARRDLEALSLAGVPVYPQRGRGGGWSLIGRARTDLSGLTAGEARALLTLVGPSTAGSPEITSVLRKLIRALPETFRADAEAAARSVVVDDVGWSGTARAVPDLVADLQTAVIERRRVALDYGDAGGTRTRRLADPWGLVDKDGTWYLIAGTDRGRRTFRLDRIHAATATDEPFKRPPDMDLGEAWEEVVDHVEAGRSRTWATVVVAAAHVPVLRAQFGQHCHADAPAADGTCRVRVAAPTPRMIAQHLAGWGAELEVEEPQAVRDELARIGEELRTRYR